MGDSNSFECKRERSRERSRRRFDFSRMQEVMIASNDSNSLEFGKRDRAGDSSLLERRRERSIQRFEFTRMLERRDRVEGEIAQKIRILSNAGGRDRAEGDIERRFEFSRMREGKIEQ